MNFIHRGPHINEFYTQGSTYRCAKGKTKFAVALKTRNLIKGTVDVISSGRSCKDDNARFTKVSLRSDNSCMFSRSRNAQVILVEKPKKIISLHNYKH